MNCSVIQDCFHLVSAGCHINDVMNLGHRLVISADVSAGCHINDVMNDEKRFII